MDTDLAYCQLYAYVSQAFRYPTPTTAAFLSDDAVRRDIAEAVRGICDRAAAPIPTVGDLVSLERDYIGIFGHTITGPVPLYELEYGEGQMAQQTYILGELAGFYSAFGLKLRETAGERVDHVSIQCEYLSVLSYRAAYARSRGHAEGEAVCRDARRKYLREHLARWGFSFASKTASHAGKSFYFDAARLLSELLRADCGRHKVEEGRRDLVVKMPEPLPSEKCGDLGPAED